MTELLRDPLVTALTVVAGLIAADIAVGVYKAILTKTFTVQKLPSFLQSTALPFVVPLLVAATYVQGPGWRDGIAAAAAAVAVKVADDLRAKLASLI